MGSELEEGLFQGEDPSSRFADDAAHWYAVYQELVTFCQAMLKDAPPGKERQVLERQFSHYTSRLEFWRVKREGAQAG